MTFLPLLGGIVVKRKLSFAALYINISIKIRVLFVQFSKKTQFSFLSVLLSFVFLSNFGENAICFENETISSNYIQI